MMMNPWRSIWTKPRETIREIVAENPNRSIWVLAFIVGFSYFLNYWGDVLFLIGIIPILIGLVLAPFVGHLVFAIWSGLLLLTGRMFKGAGSFRTIRAAQAWSSVPLVANIALYLVSAFFLFAMMRMQTVGVLQVGFVIFAIMRLVFAIWSLVLFVITLSEVQKFSVLRAIGNFVSTVIIFMGIIVVLGLVVGMFLR